MAGRYHALLSQAVQIDVPGGNYLVDIDDGFYASNYLRAWMLEGALRMLLQDNFGMEWFRDPAAGEWLKGLWSTGSTSRPTSSCSRTAAGGSTRARSSCTSSARSGASGRRLSDGATRPGRRSGHSAGPGGPAC